MLTAKTILAATILCLAAATALAGNAALQARVDIVDAAGKAIGTATFKERKEGVELVLKVAGLAPGKHGLHLHETGVCIPPDFKSAGGHFNPYHKQHGMDNPQGMHAGDLPNLLVEADGAAELALVAHGITLSSGPASLLQAGGTSLVIHAGPDDNLTDPAGNAGPRVACGVVVKVP